MRQYTIIELKNIFLAPCGRLPIERMNCMQMSSTQVYRRMAKMYLPALCPKGSSLGSAREPAMK